MHAINRTLNKDLRELSFWLNANKIALNVAKTEIILFKTRNKNYDVDLKIKNFWWRAFWIFFTTGTLLVITFLLSKGLILFTILTEVECYDFSCNAIPCVV